MNHVALGDPVRNTCQKKDQYNNCSNTNEISHWLGHSFGSKKISDEKIVHFV